MSIPWGDIATFSTAALSAVATVGAWLAAHRSAKTADTVARIEQDRWHADLLPRFQITIEHAEGDRATLSVRLVGPLSLCHRDEIRLKVVPSDGLSRLRFTPGADGAGVAGQTVAPFSLQVGTGRPFSLERTRAPLRQRGEDRDRRWRDDWLNKPRRLVLTCGREGFKTWTVPCEVAVPEATRARRLD
ncbi:hypothetical protein HEP87_09280 [Streptomyces sp. S1D4-11]|nr:hypothetical protein [Streptomyces sp. S1D4-11]QIY94197.1 hypothetical protein HEP87_09280 [Streptomyces sp. S1D4-11]